MPELLIELLSEEIPARMQAKAADDFKRLVCKGLTDARLAFESAEAFVTPRRLALVVEGLPVQQPDEKKERKGPRVGAPEKAIEGFLKSAGLHSVDQCEVREIKGAEFYFVVSEEQGRSTGSAIADILPGIVWSFPWPKSMRWPQGQGGYVRPLHNILLIFNGVPLNFMAGVRTEGGSSIPVNNITRGHRFLAPDSFEVRDFADYKKKLKAAKVILDSRN